MSVASGIQDGLLANRRKILPSGMATNTPREMSPMDQAISRLEKAVVNLEQAEGAIADALQPVRVAQPATPPPTDSARNIAPVPNYCSIEAVIIEQAERIEHIAGHINAVREELRI